MRNILNVDIHPGAEDLDTSPRPDALTFTFILSSGFYFLFYENNLFSADVLSSSSWCWLLCRLCVVAVLSVGLQPLVCSSQSDWKDIKKRHGYHSSESGERGQLLQDL